ncbi:hypothetical protein LIER_34153 [Lithospermum erythrorhizon]|uniref:Uncharacterized protein n=1 Tax=Lithospermum erythrorhizon TaxID=34254 RepID=A0AAV3S145_LITER
MVPPNETPTFRVLHERMSILLSGLGHKELSGLDLLVVEVATLFLYLAILSTATALFSSNKARLSSKTFSLATPS